MIKIEVGKKYRFRVKKRNNFSSIVVGTYHDCDVVLGHYDVKMIPRFRTVLHHKHITFIEGEVYNIQQMHNNRTLWVIYLCGEVKYV